MALAPTHAGTAIALLQRADLAMYAAKRGRLGVAVYDETRDGEGLHRLEVAAQLRQGIDEGQLLLHYQPKLDLRTGRITGLEALVRWNHPTRGLLYPDVFLPLAEQAGLMRRLALRVLERALHDVRIWRAQGHDLSVAVNLSVSNLQDVALPEQVAMLLDAFAVPAEALILEITEDVAAEPDTHWAYAVRTDRAEGGYAHTDARIWHPDGRLVAISRQTVAVFG